MRNLSLNHVANVLHLTFLSSFFCINGTLWFLHNMGKKNAKKRGSGLKIVFDPEERKEFLTGKLRCLKNVSNQN